jgi:hypothetical protein
MITDVRSRWGVEQSPVFIAMLVMAAAAILFATVAVTSGLIAGDDEFEQRFDASVWFQLATPLAIGAAALCVLLRWQSGPTRGEAHREDQTFLYALMGLSLIWALLGVFKGFDEGLDAADYWFSYSLVFALLAVGFAALARPTPAVLGTVNSVSFGLGWVGLGVVLALIGTIQGRSNDFSTFASGIALQQAGLVLMTLALAWFLGLRPASDSRM